QILIIFVYLTAPPIFARDVFNGGPETLGILLSSIGIGGILGGLITASLGNLERRGLVQLGSLLLNNCSLVLFPLSPNLRVAALCLAFSGLGEMIHQTTNQTMTQLSIPDALRGRVMGIVALNIGLAPLGAVFAGIGADALGPRTTLLLFSGLAALLTTLVF